MPSIVDLLRGNLTEYQPIPFWSWNDRLEEKELRRQICDMKQAGIGGFFMHARGGLETEYMSDEWMECVNACIDEAKKQGMHAWIYDENGWPSGFAGMKLLENPENFAHYIVIEDIEAFDPRALACYRVEDNSIVRVYDDDGSPVKAVYDRTNSTMVDVLNWKVVRNFIEETHEKYYKRFSKDFGKVLRGFFTDEPQYYRYDTAYSPCVLTRYRHKYGSDMLDELGALFIDCKEAEAFRYRYWLTVNELFMEAFAGQIGRWCQDHNCKLTGHAIDENSLHGQMSACAGIMPFYEHEDTPGMDWLGREIGNEIAPRQVSSMAMQLGKKHAITETFACCGWDVTPRELKRIVEWQYVNGVNQICHHLYPYSIRGQRKRDYPAFYSRHNPWTKDFKHFNDYFTRLGYMLSESREIADTVIIHPIHSAYINFERRSADSLAALEKSFAELCENLGAAGILHHYADETVLSRYGKVKGRKLAIGNCSYSTVIVPDMPCIDMTTVNLLRDFATNGGKLCYAGNKPRLVNGEKADMLPDGNVEMSAIRNPGFAIKDRDTEIRFTVRRSDFGDFIYAVNLSKDKAYSTAIHINAKGARRFNAETCAYEKRVFYECETGGIDIPLEFGPGESEVIFLSGTADSAQREINGAVRRIPAPIATVEEADDNTMTVDYAALSYDGINFTAEMPIMALSDRLLREKTDRTVFLKYSFYVNGRPKDIRLEAEKADGMEVRVNGIAVQPDGIGTLDKSFVSYDIAGCIRGARRNDIIIKLDYSQPEHVYKVFNGVYVEHDGTTESMVNCLSYHTDIESIYLRGAFCVEMDELRNGPKNTLIADNKDAFEISLPRKGVTVNSLQKDGFPFFGGSMKLSFDIFATGYEKHLRLNGRWQTARVSINGSEPQLMMFSDSVRCEGLLKNGINRITVELTASMRNVFGPHHETPEPEPYYVEPQTFQKYGKWSSGRAVGYTDEYSFTYFGIESIDLW